MKSKLCYLFLLFTCFSNGVNNTIIKSREGCEDCYPINQFTPPPSPHVDLVWLRLMSWYVFVNDLKGEVIVRFVDIDGLGDFFLLTYNHILRHVQSDKWCLYCYVCFSSGSLLVYYYPKRHTQIYHPTHILRDEILFLTHYYHYFKHKKHK